MKEWNHTVRAIAAIALVAGLAVIGGCTDRAQTFEVRPLTSWTTLASASRQQNLPIVLLVEQRHCAYCQALKRELFRPTAEAPEYGSKALFVSVLTDYDEPPLEKNGEAISGFEFAEQYKASTTPSVLFLDHNGRELQPRVVGYVRDADYSASFKRKIDAAAERLADRAQ